ncbi:GntR family transcriptional regulator [soil metagenome]
MASAADRAHEEICQQIVSGRYAAGAWLREENLSAALGMSRTPIREALRRLSAEGIVDLATNRGAQVTAWSDTELDEMFDLRALLEGYAARRAAVRFDDAGVARLNELVAAMDEAIDALDEHGSFERIALLNNSFHGCLLVRSGNSQLLGLAATTVQVALMRRTVQDSSRERLRRSNAQHRELVDACRARDGEWAEAVMRSHILSARHIFDLRPSDDGAADTAASNGRVAGVGD